MTNTNILEGMQCPQCGSEGPFKITATSRFTVRDDGTDDHEDVEWHDDSSCECGECDHSGTVKDYTIDKPGASEPPTPNAQKIAELERIVAHQKRFIDDSDFRAELSHNFKGFGLSGDDILTFEALTEYIAILNQKEAAP